MRNLVDNDDGYVYNLTDNEFKALYTLVNDCLSGMGGVRPSDIHEDPYTWTGCSVLTESGEWTDAEARGTYGSLDKKGLIYIEPNPSSSDAWEDTVNESTFDMFESIWDDIQSNPEKYNMKENEL